MSVSGTDLTPGGEQTDRFVVDQRAEGLQHGTQVCVGRQLPGDLVLEPSALEPAQFADHPHVVLGVCFELDAARGGQFRDILIEVGVQGPSAGVDRMAEDTGDRHGGLATVVSRFGAGGCGGESLQAVFHRLIERGIDEIPVCLRR